MRSEVFGGVRRGRLVRCTFVAHPDKPGAAEKIRYLPLDNPQSLDLNGRRAGAVESNRNRVFVSTHRY